EPVRWRSPSRRTTPTLRGNPPTRRPAARRPPPDPRTADILAATLALLVSLSLVAGAHAGRLEVCTFGFHGADEIQVFKDRLPPEDFEIVDLSPRHAAAATLPLGDRAPGARWLLDLCRPGLRCDVVVYSAEFAGSFFGASGTALSLGDMEEASCEPRCD